MQFQREKTRTYTQKLIARKILRLKLLQWNYHILESVISIHLLCVFGLRGLLSVLRTVIFLLLRFSQLQFI